jgi:hypothetical protein
MPAVKKPLKKARGSLKYRTNSGTGLAVFPLKKFDFGCLLIHANAGHTIKALKPAK